MKMTGIVLPLSLRIVSNRIEAKLETKIPFTLSASEGDFLLAEMTRFRKSQRCGNDILVTKIIKHALPIGESAGTELYPLSSKLAGAVLASVINEIVALA